MASVPVPVPDPEPEPEPPITVDMLPVIDLRGMSQSELYALSRCTRNRSTFDSDADAVIPKIDPTVFNESAGSRKQTFSRVRFASRRRAPATSRRRASATSRRAETSDSEQEKEEDPKVVELFKKLFGVENNTSGNEEQTPGNTESRSDSVSPN